MHVGAVALHLMFNLVPPFVGMMAVIMLIAGVVSRSRDLKRMGVALVVAVPILIIPVFFSGRAAVVTVGNIPGVSLELIGEHQESVQLTWISTMLGAIAAVCGLIAFRRGVPPAWFIVSVLVLATTGEGMMMRTAHLGGLIRHPEAKLISR